jgi:uncharacterized protein YuzE
MKDAYLEVTYRSGKALAAYYYLPRGPRDVVQSTRRYDDGLLVDFSRDEKPLGIEITAPGLASLAAVNRLLRTLGLRKLNPRDLKPLSAA